MMIDINDKTTSKEPASLPAADIVNPAPPAPPENVAEAHEQAEADIQKDADLSIHSPNDDLDEGELARLGEDENDIV